jgi:putative membrane protein
VLPTWHHAGVIGDVLVALGVGLAAGLYWRGAVQPRRRASFPLPQRGVGRGPGEDVRGAARRRQFLTWRAAAFATGLATLAVAILPPVDAFVDRSFAAHMVQHVLLVAVAAPLLALGEPLGPFLRALPRERRRALGRWWRTQRGLRAAWRAASSPFVVWPLALWGWHAPALFEAALRDDLVHAIEHGTFLATALLYWWPVIRAGRGRLSHAGALLYLFTAAGATSALGVLITFAPAPWYAPYAAAGASPLGLGPLEDQAAAGLVMWVGGGTIYLVAILAVFLAWLRAEDHAAARAQPIG